jgi:hypothetical protein
VPAQAQRRHNLSTTILMATAKNPKSTAPKKAAKVAPVKKAVAPAGPLKPIKSALNKTSLASHLSEQTNVEPKAVKAVLAALDATILASVNKKGLGQFTLPGLLKISAQNVPAKKKRFGKDPFTGQERWFAPKPATVRIKARALKKLKDAAL